MITTPVKNPPSLTARSESEVTTKRGNSGRGSVSVEAVLIVPVFLMVMMVILQAALWIYANSSAQAACQQGVMVATASGSHDDGRSTAQEILSSRSIGHHWVYTIDIADNSVRLTITGFAHSVIPGWDWPVTQYALLPQEPGSQFVEDHPGGR
ncbi:MAG: pilus assembly protein [Propionibacteriaceae bacterium]|jgi:hypothetical protein|nr:pilus assembly protein [Propionibacteriaceae bacterium]